jgi:phosphoglycolate phosphatase
MKYEHIIWDWNGTLLDDALICHKITQQIIHARGITETSLNILRDKFTHPIKTYYERLGLTFEGQSFEALIRDFSEEYKIRYHNCELRQFAEETLNQVEKLGITQSILSAINQEMLENQLKLFSIYNSFDKVSGLSDNSGGSKIEKGIEHISSIKLPKKSILMIGDTLHDVEVAKELGVDVVLINSGYQSEEKLLKSEKHLLPYLKDLIAYISRSF